MGAAFREGFRPTSEARIVRGAEIGPTTPLEDGTIIVLDAGVHDFSTFASAHRGAFLVRFEACVVRGSFKSLYEKSEKAAYAYEACRFEQMHPDRRRDLETRDANVEFTDCAVDYALPQSEPPAPRSVSELNASWH